jgi:hypothetical protein
MRDFDLDQKEKTTRVCLEAPPQRQGAADRGERRQVAGVVGQSKMRLAPPNMQTVVVDPNGVTSAMLVDKWP